MEEEKFGKAKVIDRGECTVVMEGLNTEGCENVVIVSEEGNPFITCDFIATGNITVLYFPVDMLDIFSVGKEYSVYALYTLNAWLRFIDRYYLEEKWRK